MFRKSSYILILFLLFLADVSAQNSRTLYYMNLPQKHFLNPALRPSNSFYFGLPGLTGINLNVSNNFVNFSDIFIPGKSDSVITFLHPNYNIDNFLSKIKDGNFLTPDINVQLFGLGFNAGKDLYIFLDVNERVEMNFVLPGDLIKLGLMGNGDFAGKTINLTTFDASARYYREAGLGFSKNIGNKLRIGAKGKVLFGLASISLDNKALDLKVNSDFTHTLNADLSASVSGPVTPYFNSQNQLDSIAIDKNIDLLKFFLNTSNLGLGLDIGAVYKISERFQVSASLTDFSYINWKSKITNMKAESQFQFSGLNITDVVNGTKTIDTLITELVDSLMNSFTFSNNTTAYKTVLPMGIIVGGSFNLTKSFSLGLLSQSIIVQKQLRQATTLSANLNLGNAFSTSLSYTASNNRFDNFGAGLAFRTGIIQFYFVSDKIPVMWNKIIVDKLTIPLPDTWNTINLRFGMNIAIGNKIKKKNDKPMLLEKKK